MSKLRWGILGTGNIARTLAKAVGESETGTLVAVGSRTQETADAFGEAWGIPTRHASYEGLLADPDVDAVYISLPNHLHAEWSIKCAEARKHILCEKPLAMNFAEAAAVIDAVRAHDVFFMEAFMYRAHRQTQKLVELIQGGAIGAVRLVTASFGYRLGPKYENIRLRNDAGGGGIMDVGCYAMSMARLVAGATLGKDFADPIEVRGYAHIGDVSRVDEWATATATFPGEIFANLQCATQCALDNQARIYGADGSIVVENPWFPGRTATDESKIVVNVGGNREEVAIPAGVPLYANEVDTVAAYLTAREAKSPAMTWADSLGQQHALDRWRAAVGLRFEGDE